MIRDLNVGDEFYIFKLKGTNWKVYGGIIKDLILNRCQIRIVFEDDSDWCFHQYNYEIGTVTKGSTIGLTVNDIELAKKLFIKHEEENIIKLQQAIEESNKRIKLIMESK